MCTPLQALGIQKNTVKTILQLLEELAKEYDNTCYDMGIWFVIEELKERYAIE